MVNNIINFCNNPSWVLYKKISQDDKDFMYRVSMFIIDNNIGNEILAYRISDYYNDKFGNKRMLGRPIDNSWRISINDTIDGYYFDEIPNNSILFRASSTNLDLQNRATYFALEIGNANQYLPTARKGLMGIYKTNKTLRMFRLDNLDNINNLLTYFFTINNKTMYNTVKEMFYTPLFDVYTEQRKSIIEQEETDNQPLQFKKLYRYSITKIDFKFANWLCNEGYNGYTAGIMRTFKGVTKDNPFPEEIMLCTPLDDVEIIQENRLKKTNRDKLDDILLYIKNSNIDYKIF